MFLFSNEWYKFLGYPKTSSQVPKFSNSGNFKLPIFKFRELQVPIKKLTKKVFSYLNKKHILDRPTAFCLSTHYSIAKLRAWIKLNLVF